MNQSQVLVQKQKMKQQEQMWFSATDDVTIIDTVNYEHLDRGKYKLTAVLMDKATKAAILDKDGKEVTASKVFSNTTKAEQLMLKSILMQRNYH